MANTNFWGAVGMAQPRPKTTATTWTAPVAEPFRYTNTPPTPYWLPQFAPGEVENEPMQGYNVPIPSMQMWNKTPSSQKAGLGSYINRWAGSVPGMVASYQDMIDRMIMMLPKSSPSGAGRWSLFSQ
jgi:hypothetical protein